ncbi:vegetative incompatibility het-e-1 [Fusarium beomiforme]|uniref:Vegetative incompatibility het-e-1 n=1 Tax=Fusarium beomiforme TaxID=44412 RepID=A0A9P5ANC0_9HYPO|nr:vegetative incompatibility het-e-1 [Fusarium beomiforme]
MMRGPTHLISSETGTSPAREPADLNVESTSPTAEMTIPFWNHAYARLKQSSEELVIEYEELLSKELQYEMDTPDDESENRIDRANPHRRKRQLEAIIENGLQRAEERKAKYTIFGKTFTPRDQMARTADFVKSIKTLVDEAVKASPEAALAWAGICTVLPILTNPSSAEAAQQDGFIYVASRMRFYSEFEHHLWPETLAEATELRRELNTDLIELYRLILEFQMTLVVRLYKTRLSKLKDDVIHHDIWDSMVSKVKQQEATFHRDFKKINDLSLRIELEKLNKNADAFLHVLSSKLWITMETQKGEPTVHNQFHASGQSKQNNNTGSGNQYAGVTFYGPVSMLN